VPPLLRRRIPLSRGPNGHAAAAGEGATTGGPGPCLYERRCRGGSPHGRTAAKGAGARRPGADRRGAGEAEGPEGARARRSARAPARGRPPLRGPVRGVSKGRAGALRVPGPYILPPGPRVLGIPSFARPSLCPGRCSGSDRSDFDLDGDDPTPADCGGDFCGGRLLQGVYKECTDMGSTHLRRSWPYRTGATDPSFVRGSTYCSTTHNPHLDRRRMHPLANLGGADESRAR
jgi:hypothetical protein